MASRVVAPNCDEQNNEEVPRVLTVRDIRGKGFGKTRIFKELKEGRLRSFQMGRRRLVLAADYRKWLQDYGAPL
jgi:hypothetical protein